MRPSLRALATPTGTTIEPASRTRQLTLDLLPPIPLYRRLLRLHRKKLTPEERVFGDTYIKSEFRRHRNIDNPLHIVGFLTEWQKYGQMVNDKDLLPEDKAKREGEGPGQVNEVSGTGWRRDLGGREWSMEYLVDKMSDQQVGQVFELFDAISKRGRESVDEEDLVGQQRRVDELWEESQGGGKKDG